MWGRRALDARPFLAVLALALVGCAPAAEEGGGAQSPFTDDELLAAAYGDSPWPADIYSDPSRPLYYVNTVSTGQSDSEWRELCTDDPAQALAWVNDSFEGETFVAQGQTDRYFEFVFDRGTYQLYARVHRCAYFDPYVYDHFNRGPERGVFNQRPVTTEAVADLGEYLWYLRHYNIGGFRPLSSSAEVSGSAIVHSLYYIGTTYGDWGLCDSITLILRTTSVDIVTGAVIEGNQVIRTVQGHCH